MYSSSEQVQILISHFFVASVFFFPQPADCYLQPSFEGLRTLFRGDLVKVFHLGGRIPYLQNRD